jgi:hypothetical protein
MDAYVTGGRGGGGTVFALEMLPLRSRSDLSDFSNQTLSLLLSSRQPKQSCPVRPSPPSRQPLPRVVLPPRHLIPRPEGVWTLT